MTLLFSIGLAAIFLVQTAMSPRNLVPYSWTYGRVVHGTIQVPPGYKAETQNYKEGIITHLRYSDSSYIVLQHGGMYRVPMFQDAEYVVNGTEERPDRTIRRGSIKDSGTLWREDNLKRPSTAPGSPHSMFHFFPPNVAYDKVPKERIDLFEEALNTFAWNTTP